MEPSSDKAELNRINRILKKIMLIEYLDHVNIRTNQLEVMVKWYTDVLGLNRGVRPEFSFNGAWMYAGDRAVVHLVEVEDCAGKYPEEDLNLEHFALKASGENEFEAALKQKGQRFRRREIPDFDLVQYHIWDPDGNHIHIDFTVSV